MAEERESVSNEESDRDVRESEEMAIGESAIDLSKEIEDLGRLQISLDRMLDCAQSPSTSMSSVKMSPKETDNKALCLSARRLIRVPCSGESPRELPFTVHGGAANAKLILVDIVRRHDLIGILSPDDRIMSIQDIPVSGMARSEVTRLLDKLCFEHEQIALEIIPAGAIPDDIREILSDKQWAELQTTIRDNLYAKTVPYTTRPPRDGEVDGEHYRFVESEEFEQLQKDGQLLEHGTYQGHLYGTPRPLESLDETTMVTSSIANSRGPLPSNWEIGYAENGDKYFIDHNNGTTTWDDPRLLPQGWEQVDDPQYGTFFVDHINKKTQYDRPAAPPAGTSSTVLSRYDTIPTAYHDTHNGNNGNGFSNGIQPSPPLDPHRTSPLAASSPVFTRDPLKLRGEMISTTIIKGPKGLGFTLIGNDASSKGDEFIQVKSILSGGPAESNGRLQPGDILVRVNGEVLLGATQADACRVFVAIPVGDPVAIQVCRGYPLILDPSNRIITENVYATGGRSRDMQDIDIFKGADGFGFTISDNLSGQRVRKILYPAQCPNLMEGDTIVELDGRDVRSIPHTRLVEMLREAPVGHRGRLVVRRSSPKHRSRTPTAAFRYGEQRGTPAPSEKPRSKTPAPNQRTDEMDAGTYGRSSTLQRQPAVDDPVVSRIRPSSTTLGFATPNYMPLSSFQNEKQSDLITVNLIRKPNGFGFRLLGGKETNTLLTVGQIVMGGAAAEDGRMHEADEIVEIDGRAVEGATHTEAVSLLEQAARNKHVKMVIRRPKAELSHSSSMPSARPLSAISREYDVILSRSDSDGFGFVIISSLNRNGSTIGQILENSPASRSGQLNVGDRVVAVNGIDILNLSHGEIVSLIKAAGLTVRLTIAPPLDAPLASSTLQRQTPTQYHNGAGNYATMGGANYAAYSSLGAIPPAPRSPAHFSNYSEISRTNNFSNGHHEPVPPSQDGPLLSVELERGSRGFGFSIRGGQEFGAMPLFVLRIADDGPAAIDGRLRVGDQLISINGHDTKGLTHEEAINLIKQHPTVRLTIRRHKLP